jgi:hypothetical protein
MSKNQKPVTSQGQELAESDLDKVSGGRKAGDRPMESLSLNFNKASDQNSITDGTIQAAVDMF